jgi:hypothetical protein
MLTDAEWLRGVVETAMEILPKLTHSWANWLSFAMNKNIPLPIFLAAAYQILLEAWQQTHAKQVH